MDKSTAKGYVDGLGVLPKVPPTKADTGFGVLVALTNDERAAAATEVARALRERRSATPYVVYVIEIGASIPEAAMVAVALEAELRDPERRAVQEAEMKSVLHLDTGDTAKWPFSIEVGSVASGVVEQAQNRGAELILMGLNRHAALGRAIGRDTVREVMAMGGIPVLAVRDTLTGLPKRIVVAVDFSRASIRAAKLARRLVDDGGEMQLLFVEPGLLDAGAESAEGLRLIQNKGVEAAFSELLAELEGDGTVRISTSVLKGGSPPAEIMKFCENSRPDLIAVGSQRHRFLDRLLLGSTARAIAADGRWSVLITPPMREENK